jgi:hypothetical protein
MALLLTTTYYYSISYLRIVHGGDSARPIAFLHPRIHTYQSNSTFITSRVSAPASAPGLSSLMPLETRLLHNSCLLLNQKGLHPAVVTLCFCKFRDMVAPFHAFNY